MPASDRPTSIGSLVRRAVTAHPARTALVDGPIRLSWSELQDEVDRLAGALMAEGLGRGDRLALQAPTSIDFVKVYLAGLQAGLVIVPINPSYTSAELDHILSDSGARMLVAGSVATVADSARLRSDHPGLARIVVAARSGSDDVLTVTEFAGRGEHALAGSVRRDRSGEELAVLLYTSGTSGQPKGAMLSARALLANLEQFGELRPAPVSGDDVLYLPLPLFHIFGLNGGLGIALYFGATVILSARFDPAASLAAIADEKVTVVVGAPREFAVWAASESFRRAFAGVRFGLSGSAPLPAELVSEYDAAGVALFEGYGLTEAAPVVTVNLVPDAHQPVGWLAPKAGSIGRPLPGVEVQLLDADGEIVEVGDLGTLEVRGANLFSGYWPDGADGPRQAENTGADAGAPASYGWFATGDLAVADDDGDFYLVGRRSDLILVNGFNVYPAEVESVLARLPGVSEVAVVGRTSAAGTGLSLSTGSSLATASALSEAVIAYVVAQPGVTLDPDELIARAAISLARFKLPSYVVEVEEPPHTATGKVMKWRLPPPEADAQRPGHPPDRRTSDGGR
ncbi:class I adenylate-forming enzyme family protein [Jatrophihabitans sp. DSM 45814]